ncbi:MAG: sigma-70 family RNA polymerase sigma factor [Verrucomicrobiota bacterium]
MDTERPAQPQENDARYELFVQRFAQHEADIRRFLRSLLPSWTDVDEVSQQTAMVLWRKFGQYDPETPFMKWACVVARFEALSYRRKMARDRLVFRDDLWDLMADEAEEEVPDRKAERDALDLCLRKLNASQRNLLTMAYTPGVKLTQVADEIGSTAGALYMRVNRLRTQLTRCVESQSIS